MKSKFLVAVLIAASASIAVPAFASGYGPSPSYRPSVGAPASQRGQSAQTVAAEQNDAAAVAKDSYGGVASYRSQSGSRQPSASVRNVDSGH